MQKLKPDYKIRPASFVSRTIGGHKAWSWSVDYTDNNQSMTYYWTVIESGKSGARFQLEVPAAQFDAVRAEFDALIETARLP